MAQAKYPHKNKKIQIFYEKETADGNVEKVFIHKAESKIWAAVRTATLTERHDLDAEQDGTIYDVVINYREGVKQDMFVIYKDKTHQIITPIDDYDGSSIEMKFKMKEINPR